jgi:methionyl-tRNA formyltransferase
MRLVILTSEGLEHRYVVSVLADNFPDALKAVVVARPQPQQVLAKIRKHLKQYTPPQLCSRGLAKCYLAMTRKAGRREEAFARQLFAGNQSVSMPRPELLRIVPSHNGKECEALLKEVRPDIIAVYGTAVIKPHIIKLAGVRALNMHTGISPRYRGSDTVFWPLYNEEPEWIGVTVHVLDEGIDSGPIIYTGRPEIDDEDDEDRLFAKCTIVGAGLYAEAIRRVMAGVAQLIPQELTTGRQYKLVDRTVFAERRVKQLLNGGLLARFARQGK